MRRVHDTGGVTPRPASRGEGSRAGEQNWHLVMKPAVRMVGWMEWYTENHKSNCNNTSKVSESIRSS